MPIWPPTVHERYLRRPGSARIWWLNWPIKCCHQPTEATQGADIKWRLYENCYLFLDVSATCLRSAGEWWVSLSAWEGRFLVVMFKKQLHDMPGDTQLFMVCERLFVSAYFHYCCSWINFLTRIEAFSVQGRGIDGEAIVFPIPRCWLLHLPCRIVTYIYWVFWHFLII